MASLPHKVGDRIAPLLEGIRPGHTWKHFYEPREHWERLAPADPRVLVAEAERAGGIVRAGLRVLPELPEERQQPLRAVLLRHHDRAYAPAYLAELRAAGTTWAPLARDSRRYVALTPQGVCVIVKVARPSFVLTAFRPLPPLSRVDWSEAEIRRHGESYFARITGMAITDDPGRQAVVRELERASSEPSDTLASLWLLVSAIGYGRLLRADASVATSLSGAELRLAGVSPERLLALVAEIAWDEALDDLEESEVSAHPEDFARALISAEELLVAAPVIDAEAAARRFLARATDLLAWAPPECADVLSLATRRREHLNAPDTHAGQFWDAAAAALAEALVRGTEPVVRPAATLVHELLPAGPLNVPWIVRLAPLAARAAAVALATKPWIDSLSAGGGFLGSGAGLAAPWVLRGAARPEAPHYRIFAIAAGEPDEITSLVRGNAPVLWGAAPGEEALLVIVESERPLPAGDMEALLLEAATRDDVRVTYRVLSRPM